MPKWKHEQTDEQSLFWKFIHTLIPQIDSRPMSTRAREGEEAVNPTLHCKQVALGQYRIQAGNNKGFVKQKQARCKYCRHRIDEAGEQGRAPRTCFQCVVHGVAVCKM